MTSTTLLPPLPISVTQPKDYIYVVLAQPNLQIWVPSVRPMLLLGLLFQVPSWSFQFSASTRKYRFGGCGVWLPDYLRKDRKETKFWAKSQSRGPDHHVCLQRLFDLVTGCLGSSRPMLHSMIKYIQKICHPARWCSCLAFDDGSLLTMFGLKGFSIRWPDVRAVAGLSQILRLQHSLFRRLVSLPVGVSVCFWFGLKGFSIW